MGSKRVGLARTQALLEGLKRSLALGTTQISCGTLTASNGLTASAGGLTVTAGGVAVDAGDVVLTEGLVKMENGGSVTQGTSKSTTVVLNVPCGKITMHNAALADAAIVTFTVTNSHARATDIVLVNHHSGGTVGAYSIDATGAASGSFKITVTNISGGSLSEALVLHFALVQIAHT